MVLLLLFSFFGGASAFGFPEMVRHHYVNCNACHVSPSGGGLLTEYGRGMATELLSTWGREGEGFLFHGMFDPVALGKASRHLNIGGDLRTVQTYADNVNVREGRFILMQASAEAAVSAGDFSLVGSFGKVNRRNQIEPEFSKFFLLASIADALQIKAGRFLPAFGIRTANHTLPTRQPLGFGFDSERHGIEAHWSGEKWHSSFSATESRLQSAIGDSERSAGFQLERFIADRFRVGTSIWNGASERQKRWIGSLHGILGFTDKFYLLTEFAWQSRRVKAAVGDRDTGIFHFGRLGYEVKKGFHLLLLEDFGKPNLSNAASQQHSFGVGVLWYPRPHFEFELNFYQRKNLARRGGFEDFGILMAHYYL